jgi:CRP/FNR family transcriptional regulator, cyclic AMP receptor protein
MTSATLASNDRRFDPGKFLASISEGCKAVTIPNRQIIFTQGNATDAVFYIREGKVRHTVTSKFGKQATLGILRAGAFLGDGCLAGQPLHITSAIAMTECKLQQIDKRTMMLALHRNRAFSDHFIAFLVARNIRYQVDLVDQLFGSGEKRLAQVLLVEAHFGQERVAETVISEISQETLANMAGITRLRVNLLMNKFRKSGSLTESRSRLRIHSSLLKVVLRD